MNDFEEGDSSRIEGESTASEWDSVLQEDQRAGFGMLSRRLSSKLSKASVSSCSLTRWTPCALEGFPGRIMRSEWWLRC